MARYEVRPTDNGYGAWDVYGCRWIENELGQDVDLAECDAEAIVESFAS